MKLVTKEYSRNTKNAKWILKETKEKQGWTVDDFYTKIVDAAGFFKSLGGYERTVGLTQISISPSKLEKREYILTM